MTSSEFSKQEYTNMKYIGEFIICEAIARGIFLNNSIGTCTDVADTTDDANFGLALEIEVAVSRVGVSN